MFSISSIKVHLQYHEVTYDCSNSTQSYFPVLLVMGDHCVGDWYLSSSVERFAWWMLSHETYEHSRNETHMCFLTRSVVPIIHVHMKMKVTLNVVTTFLPVRCVPLSTIMCLHLFRKLISAFVCIFKGNVYYDLLIPRHGVGRGL